jgi:general secretion pathway protein L
MPETTMVFRLPSSLRKTTEWVQLTATQAPVVHYLAEDASLNELAKMPGASNVHLLLPPELFLVRKLSLPGARYKLTQETLRFLTEESLPDSTHQKHWIVTERQAKTARVSGIDEDKLSALLATFSTAGLNVTTVIADGCYLPYVADSWTLIREKQSWLIGTQENTANEIDIEWLNHLLLRFPPARLHIYGELAAKVPASVQVTQSPAIASAILLYSPNEQTQRHNLLQGKFRLTSVSSSLRWLPKIAAASVILALASYVLIQGVLLWQISDTARELQTQMKASWQSWFPDSKQEDHFRFHFPREIDQHFPAAVPMLQRLQAQLQEYPDIKLVNVRYSQPQQTLTFDVTAADATDIDELCKASQERLVLEKITKEGVANKWTLRSVKK